MLIALHSALVSSSIAQIDLVIHENCMKATDCTGCVDAKAKRPPCKDKCFYRVFFDDSQRKMSVEEKENDRSSAVGSDTWSLNEEQHSPSYSSHLNHGCPAVTSPYQSRGLFLLFKKDLGCMIDY